MCIFFWALLHLWSCLMFSSLLTFMHCIMFSVVWEFGRGIQESSHHRGRQAWKLSFLSQWVILDECNALPIWAHGRLSHCALLCYFYSRASFSPGPFSWLQWCSSRFRCEYTASDLSRSASWMLDYSLCRLRLHLHLTSTCLPFNLRTLISSSRKFLSWLIVLCE